MGGKSASLLTKKQRSRVRDGFADLDEERTRRDQQRIRDRLRSGVLDFRLLADYPDRQLELAFADVPEDELADALADATLVLERVRELRGFERDELVRRARDRADAASEEADDVESLRRLDLRTEAEVRREAERAVRERLGPNRWDARANRLLRIATGAGVALLGVLVADWLTESLLLESSVAATAVFILSWLVGAAALAGAVLIKSAQALKYDVVPVVRMLRRDPGAAVRGAVGWLRRPGETLRRIWDEL